MLLYLKGILTSFLHFLEALFVGHSTSTGSGSAGAKVDEADRKIALYHGVASNLEKDAAAVHARLDAVHERL